MKISETFFPPFIHSFVQKLYIRHYLQLPALYSLSTNQIEGNALYNIRDYKCLA